MLPPLQIHKMLIDGSQWGQWSSYRLPASERCAVAWTPAGTAMHWRPATWEAQHHGLAFFWPGRWYVIHASYTLAGMLVGCYCDIVMPNPQIAPDATDIRYLDLYVDVVVRADRSVFTKDQDVYERAMRVHEELVSLRAPAFTALEALADHAQAWTGPFVVVRDQLIRTDWEQLDPNSADFAVACAQQWSDYFLEA